MTKGSAVPRSLIDILLLAFVFWFGSYASQYIFSVDGLKPLYSYFLLLVIAGFYVMGQGASRGSFGVPRDRWLRRFMGWLAAYLMFGVLAFLESSQSEVAAQSLITLFEMAMVSAAFVILMVHPRRVRQVSAGFVLLALFAVGMNIFDFVYTAYTAVPGRAAGLYVNPTITGYMIAMTMVGGIEVVPRRLRWLFVLVCSLGVLITFTRAAWIMWGVGVAWLGWHGDVGAAKRRLLIVTITSVLGLGFLLVVFSGELGALVAQTPLVHYLDPNTLARLGVGASVLSGDSADQRADVAYYALHAIADSPFIGHGIGYTAEWGFPVGPHNMYLLFLVEGGIVGLLLYLALMLLLWRSSKGLDRALVLQIIIAGLFSHNLLDQPAVPIIMVFMLAHGACMRQQQREALHCRPTSA